MALNGEFGLFGHLQDTMAISRVRYRNLLQTAVNASREMRREPISLAALPSSGA
jgi:hypothetical protein